MEIARIAELLQPFLQGRHASAVPLDNHILRCISMYIDILLRWNSRMNLTAVRSEEEIVTRHFGESLFAARLLFPDSNFLGHADVTASASAANARETRLVDMGSGAGFPGVPIKLWVPTISLTLVEANQKKSTFLREVVRSLELKDVKIENVRAETMPPGAFDVVTIRAVERFTSVIATAVGLVAPRGRICFLITSSQASALSGVPSVDWRAPVPTPLADERVVVIGDVRGDVH